MSFLDVPRVSSSFISKIGLKDNTVTLTCPLLHFRYSPSIPRERQRLNITWLINNTEINHANRSKLVITDVAMADEGMYQCFASNLLQNVQTTFRLRVAGKSRNKITTKISIFSNRRTRCSERIIRRERQESVAYHVVSRQSSVRFLVAMPTQYVQR